MSKETGYTPFEWIPGVTYYACDLCGMDRRTEAEMQEHIATRHMIAGLTPIPCVLPPLDRFGQPLDPEWRPPTLDDAPDATDEASVPEAETPEAAADGPPPNLDGDTEVPQSGPAGGS